MDNYCLYYIPKSSDQVSDILTIFFGGNQVVSNRADKGNVGVLLSNNLPIGYIIKDFSKLCKIKINGMIFLPNDYLIDVINSCLSNAGLETLPYKASSGFVVGKVNKKDKLIKTYLYEVSLGKESVYSESTFDLKENSLVVVAKSGTYLLPGRMISEYKMRSYLCNARICSNDDLQINSSDLYAPVVIDEDIEVGSDFFTTEAKVNA